jgi:endonuclease/exonuclease/phosphatase (EEP) superfamily protein YafD
MLAAGTLLARSFSHVSWPVDLLATFALQWAYLFVVLGLLSQWIGLRPAGWILLATAAAHLAWSAANGPPKAVQGAPTVTFMSFNIHFGAGSGQRILDLIASGPADVIVLSESRKSFNDRLRASKQIADQYPHQLLFHNFVKLSRWPLDVVPSDRNLSKSLEHRYNYRLTAVVRHPTTPFLLLVIAPASPRNAEMWAQGTRYLMGEMDLIERFFVPLKLPLIVLGDLNASPTGWRSRLLHERLGLVRSKPPLLLSGSWPARFAPPFRIAIDAVLIGPGASVASWHPLDVMTGSDHVPVIAEISIPAAGAEGTIPRFLPAEEAD